MKSESYFQNFSKISFLSYLIIFIIIHLSINILFKNTVLFLEYNADTFGNINFLNSILNEETSYNFLKSILEVDGKKIYLSQFWYYFTKLHSFLFIDGISLYYAIAISIFFLNIVTLITFIKLFTEKKIHLLIIILVFVLYENFYVRILFGHLNQSAYFHIFIFLFTFFNILRNQKISNCIELLLSTFLVIQVNQYTVVFLFLFCILHLSLEIVLKNKIFNKFFYFKLFSIASLSLIALIFSYISLIETKFLNSGLNILNSSSNLNLYSVKNPLEYFYNFDYSAVYKYVQYLNNDLKEKFFTHVYLVTKYSANSQEFSYFIGLSGALIVILTSTKNYFILKINLIAIVLSLFTLHTIFPFSLLFLIDNFIPEIRAVSRMYSLFDCIFIVNLCYFMTYKFFKNFKLEFIFKTLILILLLFELGKNLRENIFKNVRQININQLDFYNDKNFLFNKNNLEFGYFFNFLENYIDINLEQIDLNVCLINPKNDKYIFFHNDKIIGSCKTSLYFECDSNFCYFYN